MHHKRGIATITPEMMLQAYTAGVFPMASRRDGIVSWYTADPRGVLPLDDRFHVPRSLAKRHRRGDFTMTRDRAFERVIHACAQPRPYADETWINDQIIDAFCRLHQMGYAHSIEAWMPVNNPNARGGQPSEPTTTNQLVGGLYGLAINGAFFAESKFSRVSNASKLCLLCLVEHLRARGFALLDVQMASDHLEQFGVMEIPAEQYMHLLEHALSVEARW